MTESSTETTNELPKLLADFQTAYSLMDAERLAELFSDRVSTKAPNDNAWREVLKEDVAAYFENIFKITRRNGYISRVSFDTDTLKELYDRDKHSSYQNFGMLSVNAVFQNATAGDGILNSLHDQPIHLEIFAENISTDPQYSQWKIERISGTPIADAAEPESL